MATITAGAVATYFTVVALPLMGFIIGLVSITAAVIVPTIVYALNEPVSDNLEEFIEIMGAEFFEKHRIP